MSGGLGPEFEHVIVNLSLKSEILTLLEVQYILQTHEMHLHQFHSSYVLHLPTAHVDMSSGSRGGYNQGRGSK